MGVLSIVLMGVAAATTHVASHAIERKDPAGLKHATQALSWIQQDSASLHFELSLLHQERGELDAAIESAARAQELHDRTSYGSSLCTLYSRARQNEEAILACRHVLVSRPRDPLAAMNLALVLARNSERSPAELREAVELAELANRERHHEDPYFLKNLALIYRAAERGDDMRRTAERALEIALAQQNRALADQLRSMIAKLGTELAAH
jgi:tetratricopeptide (TPR) repeat protein